MVKRILKTVNSQEGIMFKFEPNKTYRMPPFFGGKDYDPELEARVYEAVFMSFTYTTDGRELADYLPEGFELLKPELSISLSQLKGCEFLAGGGYNIIQISVPARFNGKHDKLEGTFPLVVWENLTRPILGGREENGQPKIFADIEDIHVYKDRYFTNASYDGNTFLSLEMLRPEPVNMQVFEQIKAGSANAIVFGFRYIPKVGAPGADLSQPVIYPQSTYPNGAWSGKGAFQWIKLDKKYDTIGFPLQYEIVKQLADLPVYGIMPTVMITGSFTMRPYKGRVIG